MNRGRFWVVACVLLTSLSAHADDGQDTKGKARGRDRAKQAMEERTQRREGAHARHEAHKKHREALQQKRKAHHEAMQQKRKAFRETMKDMEPQQAAKALRTFLQGVFEENNAFLESQHQERIAAFTETVSDAEDGDKGKARRTEVLSWLQSRHAAVLEHRKTQQGVTLRLLDGLAGNPELTRKQLHESMRQRHGERKKAAKAFHESLRESRPEKGERGGRGGGGTGRQQGGSDTEAEDTLDDIADLWDE